MCMFAQCLLDTNCLVVTNTAMAVKHPHEDVTCLVTPGEMNTSKDAALLAAMPPASILHKYL